MSLTPLSDALALLKFDEHGLIPAVIQDAGSQQVLMVAWMNAEALALTVSTGKVHFYSRSRKKLWLKGESSGHVQKMVWLRTDCDADVVLVGVEQAGAACHEGYRTCFFRELDGGTWKTLGEKLFDPAKVYGKS
jgi:phosphoribosyl-AMP cyclohydrolase